MAFWDTITTKLFSPKPAKQVFRVGEGMTGEQKQKAIEVIGKEGTAQKAADAGSFWGITKATVSGLPQATSDVAKKGISGKGIFSKETPATYGSALKEAFTPSPENQALNNEKVAAWEDYRVTKNPESKKKATDIIFQQNKPYRDVAIGASAGIENQGNNIIRGVVRDIGAVENKIVPFVEDIVKPKKTVALKPFWGEDAAEKIETPPVKKYNVTKNINDKNDAIYIERVLGKDAVNDIKSGKMINFRGNSYSDMAKINIISEVPKTTEQLLEGKVKDVKLKSNTLYHGTSAESASAIEKGGYKTGASLPESAYRGGGYDQRQNSISFAETPKDAERFSKLTRDGRVLEARLKDNSKVVSIDGVEDAVDLEDYIDYLKKNKIDAVYIGGGEKEVVVINPKAIQSSPSIPKDIDSSVLQSYNPTTDVVEFKVIPKGELANFHNMVDDTGKGIAGHEIDGKIWHLTAKTPESMLDKGAVYSGVAKTSDVPKLKADITSEAKKYKTKEEFVKAQGTPVYRADKTPFDPKLMGENTAGLFVAPSENLASFYGEGGKRQVQELFISPDAKILEWRDIPDNLKDFNGKDIESQQILIKNYAKENGYDVVGYEPAVGYKYGIENQIVNPDVIKTKSQLEDIWNKSNAPSKQLRPIDQLISQGKIRVKRVGTNDVYEYKKGAEWMKARDEDSAVNQFVSKSKPTDIIPKAKISPQAEEKISRLETEAGFLEDQLKDHPAKALLKFKSKKEGEILDFKNPELAKTPRESMRILERNKKLTKAAERVLQANPKYADTYDDIDAIKEVVDEYDSLKNKVSSMKAQIKTAKAGAKAEVKETKRVANIEKIISDAAEKRKEIFKTSPLPSSKLDTTKGEARSLEIASEKLGEVPIEELYKPVVSSPNSIPQERTKIENKVHLIDTYLRTPEKVMQKIGFGKEARLLRDAKDSLDKELPKNLEKITAWSKRVPAKSNERIFKWLDGQPIDLTDVEQGVANEIKVWLKDWAKRLELPADNQLSHYITHIFDKELLAKEFDEDLAKLIAEKIPGQVYDPFLLKRLGKLGYKQDTWAALDAYVKRATRKVHLDPVLDLIRAKTGVSLDVSPIEDSQFRYIQKYINNVNMRPSEFDNSLDNLLKYVIGYKLGQRPSMALFGALRRVVYRGMLGLNVSSALRNMSQSVNTYAVLGEKHTTLGAINMLKRGAMEELNESGVLADSFVQDRQINAIKKSLQKADSVLFAMFSTVEKINRGISYFGGKSKALAEGRTMEEAKKIGVETARKTQFKFDAVDTPVGMSSELAKTLFQMQNYTIKQIEFLGGLAKDRNYAALLRYIGGGLAFVYTIGRAFGMKPEELIPMFRFDVPPSLKAPFEIGKALVDAPDKFGKKRSTEKKISDVAKSLIPYAPAGSQAKKTYEGIQAVKQGGSFTSNGNLQFTVGLTPAQKVQAYLFGKYAGAGAKEYFDKMEGGKDDNPMKSTYEKVQSMKETDPEGAKSIIDSMTDEEYEQYKDYKATANTAQTLQGKKDMLPKYIEIQKTKATDEAKAKEMVDDLTDDEYKYYQLIKKQVEKDKKASTGVKPEFENNEPQTAKSIINTVFTYAKAIGVDPKTAFDRIFTGQKIRYVKNGVVVVERLPLEESQKVKEDRGGKNSGMKLDHTVPLQLGGSNSEDNLVIVPTEVWKTYTPVENYLGNKTRSGDLSKKEAQELITKFKLGKITAESIYSK